MNNTIQLINPSNIQLLEYKACYVSCIILTQNHKILLQQRGKDWPTFPDLISTFGGRLEGEEKPMQALIRELQEELGAKVKAEEVTSLGVYTEAVTNHTELVYGYFWHDLHGTISGCYEGEATYFETIDNVLAQSNLMVDVAWLLQKSQEAQLLNCACSHA